MEETQIVEEVTEDEVNFKVEESATQEKKSGLRTLKEITDDLSKELPERVIKTRKQGGATVKYISWVTATKVLSHYAPGWQYKIGDFKVVSVPTTPDAKNPNKPTSNSLFVVEVSLGIPTSDFGTIWRSATGIETYNDKMFGDVASNSTSMALRRAASLFGLCRYLYPN